MPKSEFDATMERVRATMDRTFRILDETKRTNDDIEEMRTGQRPRHLQLVPPLEVADDE